MKDKSQIMNWKNLLNFSRFDFDGKTSFATDNSRSPSLVDLDRITFSNFFRTLQDKTQVHPLNKEGRVRSRLTHSIEVASVGRSLGYGAGNILKKIYKEQFLEYIDIGNIVQAACLAHDIGNLPFGHQGEIVIRNWFKENYNKVFNDTVSEAERQDLLNFDGNAQGLRVLNSLGMYENDGGFRLTFATLGTFCKYPRFSEVDNLNDKYRNHIGGKKCGIFQSEAKAMNHIAEALGLIKIAQGQWVRHPLVYLLEAADDICYSVADLEDGVNIDLVDFSVVESLIAPLAVVPERIQPHISMQDLVAEILNKEWYKNKQKHEKLGFLRGKAIGNLIIDVLRVFEQEEQSLLSGTLNYELLSLTVYDKYIKECKKFASKNLYFSNSNNIISVSCFKIIGELLEIICNSLFVWDRYNDQMDTYAKESNFKKAHPLQYHILKNILGNTHMNSQGKTSLSRYQLLLRACDFISYLSDHQALKIYRQIQGIL